MAIDISQCRARTGQLARNIPTDFHLETVVFSNLLVWADGSQTRDLDHWRSGSRQDIDFVLIDATNETHQVLGMLVEKEGLDRPTHALEFNKVLEPRVD